MAESKKRKRQSNGLDTPNKKTGLDTPTTGTIAVTHAQGDGPHPVLAASQGLTAPHIQFNAYARLSTSKPSANGAPKPSTHNLLLHSSKHPRLDYTASPTTADSALAHYLAVFDYQTNTLTITPAYHTRIHASLRSQSQDKRHGTPPRSIALQRQALGQEFGTKKAKKAIESRTLNSITKSGPAGGKQDDAQAVVLESVALATGRPPAQEDQLEATLAEKPIPKPHLAASTVEEIYPLTTLIPSGDMRSVHVTDWQDKARANEGIDFGHRFPASRAGALLKADHVLKLKALRYLAVLLEFHDALQKAGRSGLKVPKREVLIKKLESHSEQLIDSVRLRFSDDRNELNKWHMDNLYTHIFALSLYIDDWVTDTSNLRDDLKMETKLVSQYLSELGCKVSALPEKERQSRKMSKTQAATIKIAKLNLPLEFPKPRSGRRR